jgi:hypothetical protein
MLKESHTREARSQACGWAFSVVNRALALGGFFVEASAWSTIRRIASERVGRSVCFRRQLSIAASCSSSNPIRTFFGNLSGRGAGASSRERPPFLRFSQIAARLPRIILTIQISKHAPMNPAIR